MNFYCTIQVLKHRAATRKGSFMLLKVSSFQKTLFLESASTTIFGKIILCISTSLYHRLRILPQQTLCEDPIIVFFSPPSWCMTCPFLLPAMPHGSPCVARAHPPCVRLLNTRKSKSAITYSLWISIWVKSSDRSR